MIFWRIRNTLLPVAIVAVFMAVSCRDVRAQTVDSWHGKLSAGPTELTLVFHFSTDAAGQRQCTMDSPDQNVKGIPAQVDYLSADSMSVRVPAIGASFAGRIEGGNVTGTFRQNGYAFALVMARGALAINRPQTPKAPFPYPTEDVVFTAPDGAKLSGTLTLPAQAQVAAQSAVPAQTQAAARQTPVVLLVSGSGQQDRDETLFDHKPFMVIADFLARNGIASLRYDDRGAGQSERGVIHMTLQSNKADAAAGLAYLRSTGKFGKIGVLGHSEGGRIATMLAAEGVVDFIVSLAGPSVSGKRILVEQSWKGLSGMGFPDTAVAAYCNAMERLIDLKIQGAPDIDMDKLLTDAGAENLPESLKTNFQALSKTLDNSWMLSFIQDDPTADLQKIHAPVMALFGEKDIQVPAVLNREAMLSHLPASSDNLMKIYPGLNHLFQHAETGMPEEYNTIEETISPEVLRDMADWIKDNGD